MLLLTPLETGVGQMLVRLVVVVLVLVLVLQWRALEAEAAAAAAAANAEATDAVCGGADERGGSAGGGMVDEAESLG